jgi:hypothetical protein
MMSEKRELKELETDMMRVRKLIESGELLLQELQEKYEEYMEKKNSRSKVEMFCSILLNAVVELKKEKVSFPHNATINWILWGQKVSNPEVFCKGIVSAETDITPKYVAMVLKNNTKKIVDGHEIRGYGPKSHAKLIEKLNQIAERA